FNHGPAELFLNTGFPRPGRPSMGSWVTYGLGSETSDLPAFVVLTSGGGSSGGPGNWSAGFLPSRYQGVPLRSQGAPILNATRPAGIDARAERDMLDLVRALNRRALERTLDPEIEARIAS